MVEGALLNDGGKTATSGNGDNMGNAPTWLNDVPQDLRGEKSLQQIPDIPTLAQNYLSQIRYNVGAIKMPTDKSTPEEISTYLDKLGRPQSPDKYTRLDTSTLPEGMEVHEDSINEFYKAAHEAGLTNEQATKVMQWFHQDAIKDNEDEQALRKQQHADSESALKKEWGKAYNDKMALANTAFDALTTEAERKHFVQMKLNNDVNLVRFFARLGEKMHEDRSIDGSDSRQSFIMTPQEARNKITSIKADPKHPYNTIKGMGDPVAHAEAVEEMAKLVELAYPTQ